MAKDRNAVTCNGRTAFYACMYEDIRQCAMDCGWAVALHGSLASDMDIMAMPWVDNAVSFKEMVDRVSKLFKDNELSSQYVITYNEKPYNRVVATIPIFADFYLDISTITADVVPKSEVENIISNQRQRLNEYKKQIVTLQEKLEQAKAYAAKEIFDELEREIEDALKNNYEALRRFEDSDDLWHNVNGKINTLRGLEHFIGELKKKFEGKYGGSQ